MAACATRAGVRAMLRTISADVPRTMTHAFSSGVKEVFRVKLASGRELHATARHPFLAYGGSSLLAPWMVIALLVRVSDAGRQPVAVPATASPDEALTQVVRR